MWTGPLGHNHPPEAVPSRELDAAPAPALLDASVGHVHGKDISFKPTSCCSACQDVRLERGEKDEKVDCFGFWGGFFFVPFSIGSAFQCKSPFARKPCWVPLGYRSAVSPTAPLRPGVPEGREKVTQHSVNAARSQVLRYGMHWVGYGKASPIVAFK